MYSTSLSARLLASIRKKTFQAAVSKSFLTVGTDALSLSVDMKYDRSNISRALNKLFRDGILVKVKGRPTLYFDKKTLYDFYTVSQLPGTFESLEHMISSLSSETSTDLRSNITAFSYIIGTGKNESLYDSITAIVKTVLYPSRIHGFILCGEQGTGKERLCNSIYVLESQKGQLRDPKNVYSIDLSTIPSVEDLSRTINRGTKYHKCGLTFSQLENCPESVQQGFIKLLQDLASRNTNEISCFVILCTDAGLAQKVSLRLSHSVECVYLPRFDDRSVKEKMLFILEAFQRQCNLIKTPIKLNGNCFHSFLASGYRNHIVNLFTEVELACKNAYYRSYPNLNVLELVLNDLSERIFQNIRYADEVTPILNSISSEISISSIFFYPNQINKVYTHLAAQHIDKHGFFEKRIFALPQSHFSASIDLTEKCRRDLEESRAPYIAAKDAKTHQLLKKLLQPHFPESFFNQNIKPDYCGFYIHFSDVIDDILLKEYGNVVYVPSSDFSVDSSCRTLAAKLVEAMEENFEIAIPSLEKKYAETYLTMVRTLQSGSKIKVAVLCQWEEAQKMYADYAQQLAYETPQFLLLDDQLQGRERQEQIDSVLAKIAEIYEDKGLILLSDGPLDEEFRTAVYHRMGDEVVIVNYLSRNVLRQVLKFADEPSNTTDAFEKYHYNLVHDGAVNDSPIKTQISRIIKNIIGDSLIFLDPAKIYSALVTALMNLLADLPLTYSDNLALRFIVHSSFMTERCIKGETLPYKKVNEFVEQHKSVFLSVKKHLEPIQSLFNMQIPDTELAYLTEIVLEFLDQ